MLTPRVIAGVPSQPLSHLSLSHLSRSRSIVSRNPAPPPGVQIPPPPDRDDARTGHGRSPTMHPFPHFRRSGSQGPSGRARRRQVDAAPPGRRVSGNARASVSGGRQERCRASTYHHRPRVPDHDGSWSIPSWSGADLRGRETRRGALGRARCPSAKKPVDVAHIACRARCSSAADEFCLRWRVWGSFGRPPRLPSRRQCVDLLIMQQHT